MTSTSPVIRLACSKLDRQEVIDFLELASGAPYLEDAVEDAEFLLKRACDFLNSELAVDPPPRRGDSWGCLSVSYGFPAASPALMTELDIHFNLTPATPRVRHGAVTMIVTGSLSDWAELIREADDAPDPDVREAVGLVRDDLRELYPTAMADLLAGEAEDATAD